MCFSYPGICVVQWTSSEDHFIVIEYGIHYSIKQQVIILMSNAVNI